MKPRDSYNNSNGSRSNAFLALGFLAIHQDIVAAMLAMLTLPYARSISFCAPT